jgi:hypothetical protein
MFVNGVHYRQQKEGKPTEPLTEKEIQLILVELEVILKVK